ncbi:hypothetical protein [Sphingomicrobium marinum]|uniref:hypothetical protein n=1 Tax=Sphingomicrobium marinum TaxID=1227950 RepID=UPI00223F95A6|nr:hypothetical protein [Sphingomicrobium marinum]
MAESKEFEVTDRLEKKKTHLIWLSLAAVFVSAGGVNFAVWPPEPGSIVSTYVGIRLAPVVPLALLAFALPWQAWNYFHEWRKVREEHFEYLSLLEGLGFTDTIEKLATRYSDILSTLEDLLRVEVQTAEYQKLLHTIEAHGKVVQSCFESLNPGGNPDIAPEKDRVPAFFLNKIDDQRDKVSRSLLEVVSAVKSDKLTTALTVRDQKDATANLAAEISKLNNLLEKFDSVIDDISTQQKIEWVTLHSAPFVFAVFGWLMILGRGLLHAIN